MRLTAQQQHDILQIVHQHVGAQTRVGLYGSRVRDDARGGDVDLLVEGPRHLTPLARAALQLDLQQALELPVDILYRETGKPLTAFQSIAAASAQPLSGQRA